jgi:hypothetical protein
MAALRFPLPVVWTTPYSIGGTGVLVKQPATVLEAGAEAEVEAEGAFIWDVCAVRACAGCKLRNR